MACKYKSKVWDNGWCNVACMYCTLTQESTCERNKQTNADRIRAMSDEELAKVIICPKQVCDKIHILVGRTDCEACSLEWLKQPAEAPKEEM